MTFEVTGFFHLRRATASIDRYPYVRQAGSSVRAKVAESGLTQRPAEPPIAGSNPALGLAIMKTSVSDSSQMLYLKPGNGVIEVRIRILDVAV